MYRPHFDCYSSADGHLCCFHNLLTVSNAAMIIGAQISLRPYFLIFVPLYISYLYSLDHDFLFLRIFQQSEYDVSSTRLGLPW